MTSTTPAAMSVMAGAVPRYDTCVMSVRVISLNSSMPRWAWVPSPIEA